MRKIQVYVELAGILISIIVQIISTASAANLDLSSGPLFLANTTPPNILILLDNSLSTDYEILAKSHWERAAYEYNYASGSHHAPTAKDQSEGLQLASCINPDDDCGILREDGQITLSGPDLADAKGCTDPVNCNPNVVGNSARNYLSYEYLSSCYGSQAPCCNNRRCIDDNYLKTACLSGSGNIFSLANCPATEALDWRVRSAALNVMYYNPNVNYKPWKLTNYQNANFKAALSNPYPTQRGFRKQVDLSSQAPLGIDPTSSVPGFVYYVWIDDKGYSGNRPRRGANINMTNVPNGNGMVDLWDSHYKVTVTANSMTVEKITCSNTYNQDGSLNCTSTPSALPANVIPNRTLAEEQQNIANWFQYYRRRLFTMKAMISEIPYIEPGYRYGLMTMTYNQSKLIIANDNNLQPLQNITGNNLTEELIFEFPQSNAQTQFIDFQQHNQNMLNALFMFGYSGYTYTRETLNQVGNYYRYKDANNNPLIPGTKIDPITNECQRNYSLIITDGYYIIPSFNTLNSNPIIGDTDSDGSPVTLADVARYYYVNDIRSDFPDILNPTSCDDPNNYPKHQHMVTFGISLGADGKLKDANGDGWPDNIVNPSILCPPPLNYTNVWNQTANASWANQPQAGCNDCPRPERIDDLWHAAYNSHGAYTFAQDPEKLRSALLAVMNQISTARTFASSASSSSYYSSGSRVFLTNFESQYWTGDLQAFPVDAQGNLSPISDWSAAGELNNTGYATRNIFSYKPVQHQPIAFAWGQLDLTQQNVLNSDSKGQERVDFLRGRGAAGANWDTGWVNDPTRLFRNRPGVLGDIIQSDPVYVAQPFFRYDEYNCTGCSAYSAFKSASRGPMVYVGANDGMLHGFDAHTGQEKMAYIPGSLIDRLIPGSSLYKLNSLSSRDYTHQYYVDGPATVGDIYDGAWHTVLVGSLRAGGQAVFALDITDPTSFSTANVLWEFSDNDDPDLGYTFSRPVIVHLHNDRWAAIFGNGYNNTEPDGNDPNDNTKRNGKTVVSSSGEAVLYVYYLDNPPTPPIKISTGVGTSQDPTHAGRPNGLATPAVVDVDDDLTADYVYVGDLFGNLWKFDIRDTVPSNWTVVNLFKAVDSQNNPQPQPITVRPVVDFHPYGKAFGQMIYFGTGKYFENSDNQYNGATQQSFYGIWDYNVPKNSAAFNRNTAATATGCQPLFEQDISPIGTNFRKTAPASGSIQWLDSSSAQCNRGWYMDFPLGEKQVSNPTLRNKRVIFTTLVLPQTRQTCDSDGSSSWLMVVDANDGGTLNEVTFDLNGDFHFDSADLAVTGGSNVSGKKSQVGALPKPGLISYGDVLIALARGTEGKSEKNIINPGPKDVGRQSWRQLWR